MLEGSNESFANFNQSKIFIFGKGGKTSIGFAV